MVPSPEINNPSISLPNKFSISSNPRVNQRNQFPNTGSSVNIQSSSNLQKTFGGGGSSISRRLKFPNERQDNVLQNLDLISYQNRQNVFQQHNTESSLKNIKSPELKNQGIATISNREGIQTLRRTGTSHLTADGSVRQRGPWLQNPGIQRDHGRVFTIPTRPPTLNDIPPSSVVGIRGKIYPILPNTNIQDLVPLNPTNPQYQGNPSFNQSSLDVNSFIQKPKQKNHLHPLTVPKTKKIQSFQDSSSRNSTNRNYINHRRRHKSNSKKILPGN